MPAVHRLQLYGFTAVLLVTLCAPARAADPPLWTRALAENGYHAPQTDYEIRLARAGGYAGVAFLSDDVVAAWFLTRSESKLRDRKQQTPGSFTLHAVFFRVSDAQIIAELDFPGSLDARLIATHDGEFLIYSAGLLSRYSAEMKLIQRLDMQLGAGEFFPSGTSPDGRQLALLAQSPTDTYLLHFDTDSLKLLEKAPHVAIGTIGPTDSAIYVVGRNKADTKGVVMRGSAQDGWKAIFAAYEYGCLGSPIAAVAEDLIAVPYCQYTYVFDSQGHRRATLPGEPGSVSPELPYRATGMSLAFLILTSPHAAPFWIPNRWRFI